MSAQPVTLQPATLVDIKQILFATDFSPSCTAALPYLCAIARQHHSTVHVMHVLPPEPYYQNYAQVYVPFGDSAPQFVFDPLQAQVHMDEFLGKDMLAGIPHDKTVERGSVLDAIEKAIKTNSIDLVVIGTHGHSAIGQVLMGSVAEQIFRDVTCPVLTVGPKVHGRVLARGRLETILFATDFSAGSLQALPYATELAVRSDAALKLLHVCDGPAVTPFMIDGRVADSGKRLGSLVPHIEGLTHSPECIMKTGVVGDVIVDVAYEVHADIVVMGAHRTRMLQASSHLPWATAYKVVAHAPCPVLTVCR